MSKKNVEAIYPLSFSQQGMLFETLYTPELGIHIEQFTCVLDGKLNFSAFEQGWQQIIERHAIFRTGFVWKDQEQPLQVVLRQVEIPIERQDWRQYSLSEQQEQLEAFIKTERDRGLNLTKPPLMRLALLQMGEETYQFVWTHHHILMDGWCVPLVFQEVLSCYQAFSKGQNLQLKPVRPYRDYITWLQQQDLSQIEVFWRRALQGFTKSTPLGKIELGNCSATERYGEESLSLNASNTATLKSLAKANRLTLNTVVQGVWALLLCRYSHEEDVLFGITVSGRPPSLPGVESTIGLFINTLPLRLKINPQEQLWLWLQDIQTYNFELRQYEHSHSGQVHQWSEVPGALPLYESILVFENYPVDSAVLQSSDFKIDISDLRFIGAQTKYALTLLVTVESELELKLIYDARRFDSADVALIREHFVAVLQNLISEPEISIATLLGQIPVNQIPKFKTLQLESEKTFVTPRTPIEEVIAGIWTQVLGLEKVGSNDNFFELGGHSLLATQIISRLRDAFQVELPLRYLFESPTIAELAQSIEKLMKAGQGLKELPIQPCPRETNLPLSFAQQRLWFIDQLEPGSSLYNDTIAVRLTGRLNIAALAQSLNEIVQRHEALRTTFTTVDGQPVQVITPVLRLSLPIVDLRSRSVSFRESLSPNTQQIEIEHFAAEESQRPFNLAEGPLLRVMLLQLNKDEHVLLFTIHHIVSDAWSMGLLVQEAATLYEAFNRGQPSPLPELPIQYADFAYWQQQWLVGEVLETQLSYWQRHLSGAPTMLKLPMARPRPRVQTFGVGSTNFVIPKALTEEIKTLSRQEGVTLFMTLLATLQTLLSRYTHQEDIVVGTDVANRNRSNTEQLIGFFVNLLVLRTDLSGNPSFRELLRRVREVALGAYAHQDLPFAKLVDALQPERKLGHTPLFQILFVLQNTPNPTVELSELTLTPMEINTGMARFDLALFVTETEQGLMGTWKYSTDLFDADSITRMSGHFETLLKNIVAQPDTRINSLEMLTEPEKKHQSLEQKQRQTAKLSKFKTVKPKAVSLPSGELIKTDFLHSESTLPLVIQPDVADIELADWATSHRDFIETQLLKHGAILFRNFNINSVSEFENVAGAICPNLFGEYGDLPREGLGGKVYGSTPYPNDKAILFHNESSHLQQWPMKIWFFCVQPAQLGGETPIVDCRKIYQLLNPKLRERFADKKLMYVRNFTEGLDVSWQEFFRTTEKALVEDYCRQAGMDFEWSDNSLRTRSYRQAIAKHPRTDELVFFNQLQLHHISYLDSEIQNSLLSLFGEQRLPRHVYYGDGSPIEQSVIQEISEIYQQSQVSFTWQKGDIIMLDNMLAAHGRNSFVGSRKIVVAMGEMISFKNLDKIKNSIF
ncbi:condensation domain-containing protein [Nostoc sp. UIC 10607]|uniref:condensation domain-containing protein n=1 Tax=Nostoc sp. UIC 10607 TaxID=3045935 RepID=UPI0039A1C977